MDKSVNEAGNYYSDTSGASCSLDNEQNNQSDSICGSSGLSFVNEEYENSMMSALNCATALIGSNSTMKYPKKYSFYFKNQFSPSKSDLVESSVSILPHQNYKSSESSVPSYSMNEDVNTTSYLNAKPNESQSDVLCNVQHARSSLLVGNDVHSEGSSLLSSTTSMSYRNAENAVHESSTNRHVKENDNSSYSPNDENYWCPECNKMYHVTLCCSKHPLLSITDKVVQTAARASLPSILLLRRIKKESQSVSESDDNDYGIFAKNPLPRRARFGPVKGILGNCNEINKGSNTNIAEQKFMLTVLTNESELTELKVDDENTSNWMRFIRPAEKFEEQNLIVNQYGLNLYFTATEVIKPKQELRVWYGIEYAMKRKLSLLIGDPYYRDVRMYIKYGILPSNLKFTSTDQEHKEEDIERQTKNPGDDATKRQKPKQICQKKTKESSNVPTYSYTKTRFGRIVKPRDDENAGLNKNIWLCKVCYLPFKNEILLSCHSIIHRKHIFASKNVDTTQDDEISSSEYKCPNCEQKFIDAYSLAEHVDSHSLEKECENVNSVSGNDNKIDDVHGGKQRQSVWCRLCRGLFFDNHWLLHKVKKTFDCVLCSKVNMQKKEVRQHLKTHKENGQFKCPNCTKVTDRYIAIYKHIVNCHGELKTCHHCGAQFRDRQKLLLHISRHMNGKTFLCAICGKQFSRVDKLNNHIKNLHKSDRDESKLEKIAQIKERKEKRDKLRYETLRYKCHICKLGYRLSNSFLKHINNVHPSVDVQSVLDNEKSSSDQQSTLFTSSMTRQCECQWCFRKYSKRSNLLAHQRKKHKEFASNNAKPIPDKTIYMHQCEWCLKRYSKRWNLLAHQRKSHKEQLSEKGKNTATNETANLEDETRAKVISGSDIINLAQIFNASSDGQSSSTIQIVQDGVQLNDMNEEIEFTATIDADVLLALKQSLKNSTAEIVDINHMEEDNQTRNTPNSEQYLQCLKLLSSSGMVSPTAEHTEGTFSVINVDNATLLQQILSVYPFINQT